MKVVIVGGSVAGLMHGVMLKHAGHTVHILERVPRDLEAQGAGVSTADEVTAFLAKHDRIKAPLSLPSDGMRVFDPSSTLTKILHFPMQMCTWDAMYYRLRANFDGLVTDYCPAPLPPDLPSDGATIYDVGKEVVAIEDEGGEGGRITVRYRGRQGHRATAVGDGNDAGEETSTIGTITADLVIGADGATSTVRSLLAPHAPPRQYAGYVAWRGIAPETAVPQATRDLLFGSFTFHTAHEEYAVVYPVPGCSGSLAPGSRALNFVWYSWQTPAQLADILTDVDGHRHRWSTPSGKLRPEVWERQRAHGLATLSKEFGHLIQAAKEPFIQAVSDCAAPSGPGPTFLRGRVLLVGDAQCVIRPHTGFALNQAARHCRELERRLPLIERRVVRKGRGEGESEGEEDCMAEWDRIVLDFGHVVRLRSVAFGLVYLRSKLTWLPAVLRWKWAEFWLGIRERWRRGRKGGPAVPSLS